MVAEAADGEEAVALYKVSTDMVTMDITMPKMDGITAIKEIMKIAQMPKSLSAAPWGEAYGNRSPQCRRKDFLVKPFDAERVVESLRKISS